MNHKPPLVTIAIPTFNRADTYLAPALESALSQTYANIEIIVSDNCSTDHTESVVKGFNDKRIRYVRQEKNIGGVNNSNYCLEQAKGVYFTQLHDDNLMDPDFIESCLKAVNYSHDVGIIRTGTRWIDAHGHVLKELPNMGDGLPLDAFFRAYFSGKAPMYLCSTLFNTARIRELGGFHSKHNLLEDVMADVKIGTRYGRRDIQDMKASFRIHDSEMTWSVKVSDWCEESLILIDLMCDLAPTNKNHVRAEGMRAMASFMYQLARKIKSPRERFLAYGHVFKTFEYKQFPPSINRLIYSNIFIRGLRFLKRRLATQLEFAK